MKNIVLVLNIMVLIMTLSIVILPSVWIISVVGGADGLTGVVFPFVWTVYAILVFITSGSTVSWLLKKNHL